MFKYVKIDLSKLPDCCALSLEGSCNWLELSVCRGEKCNIKRTAKEYNDSLNYVYQRLSILEKTIQIKIARKYYNDAMPWNMAKVDKNI